METQSQNKHQIPSGENLKVAILLPYFNEKYGLELLSNTKEILLKHEVQENNIDVRRVPGALELPYSAQKTIKSSNPDVVIALGIIIRGETSHYDYVCSETFKGLMDVQIKLETPIVFGILTCENKNQAKERILKTGVNKGKSFAETAIIQACL